MLGRIEQKFAHAGQKAMFGLGAMFCLFAGFGFLTIAAWIWIAAISDAITAAVVIGAFYVGVGFILLACALMRPVPREAAPKSPPNPPTTDAPPLMAAFIYGMQAGAQSGSSKKKE